MQANIRHKPEFNLRGWDGDETVGGSSVSASGRKEFWVGRLWDSVGPRRLRVFKSLESHPEIQLEGSTPPEGWTSGSPLLHSSRARCLKEKLGRVKKTRPLSPALLQGLWGHSTPWQLVWKARKVTLSKARKVTPACWNKRVSCRVAAKIFQAPWPTCFFLPLAGLFANNFAPASHGAEAAIRNSG